MGKWDPLGQYLTRLAERGKYEARMTFEEIEKVIGAKVPPGARKHQAGWANDYTQVRAQAWLDVGWMSKDVDVRGGEITFYRSS